MPQSSLIDTIDIEHGREIDRKALDFGDHEGITRANILRWLSQFPGDTDLAIKALRKITYYSTSNLRAMTHELAEMAWQTFSSVQRNRVFYVPMGGPSEGCSVMARALRDVSGVNPSNIVYMTDLTRLDKSRVGALVFLDGFSGTGNAIKKCVENNNEILII